MQTMKIDLTKREIDAFFKGRDRKRWDKDLAVYDYLLANLSRAHALPEYSTRFNYFYQVRRNAMWRKKFYAVFYAARGGKADFGRILSALFKKTGQVEASFASKMAATLDPSLPIIDRHVLSYVGCKLPLARKGATAEEIKERLANIVALHGEMEKTFRKFLRSAAGRHLLQRFRSEHPESMVSDMKMLDFVLWQSGGKKRAASR